MPPYLMNVIFAEFVLLGIATLVGAVLLIRHILREEPLEGDPAYTKEKIAWELTQEIERLKELRTRIHPAFATPKEEVAAPATTAEPAVALTPDERAKLEKDLEAKFTEKIEGLEKQNKELAENLEKAKSEQPAAAAAPASDGASTEALIEAQKDAQVLKQKVEVLEKTLTEYQIFENDIALVKKYKTENEELRKQLAATPQVTEDDIASLFDAMNIPGAPAATPPAATAPTAPAPTPMQAPGFTQAPPAQAAPPPAATVPWSPPAEEGTLANAPENVDESLPSLDDMLKEAENAASKEAAPAAEPGYVQEATPSEPSIGAKISSDDLEALAHTDQDSDDKLMAEFQKILGGDNKT